MIVVDASALLEFLLQTSIGVRVEARLFRDEDELHAPHLVDVEVVQGLRRLVRMGEVSSGRADEAIVDLADLDLHRHPHVDLLGRAWKLRDNVSAYDAMYVALAEAIEATIVTCDRPLAKAPGRRTRVEVIDGRSSIAEDSSRVRGGNTGAQLGFRADFATSADRDRDEFVRFRPDLKTLSRASPPFRTHQSCRIS